MFNINACVNNEINNSILFEEVNTKKQLNGKLYRINNFYQTILNLEILIYGFQKTIQRKNLLCAIHACDGQNLFDNEKTWGGTDWGG